MSGRLLYALVAVLLALMIAATSLALVREFHEQPIKVYYCDDAGCDGR